MYVKLLLLKIMKILAVSDLHLRSNKPKAAKNDVRNLNEYGWRRNPLLLRTLEKTVVPFYNSIFEANLRPSVTIDDFLSSKVLVLGKINEVKPDLVIVVGDVFDLSGKAGRDTEIHEDVFQVVSDFVKSIKAPVVFLPGNSDVINFSDLEETLKKLGELDTIELLYEALDDFSFSFGTGGNFVIEANDCLIAGLNSVPVAEYHKDDSENRSFLTEALRWSKTIPVIVFTHHPPFKVLSFVSRKILKTGIPSQTWIIDRLKSYTRNTSEQALVVSGHCHRFIDKYEGNIREICLLPMLTKQGGAIQIGTIIDVSYDGINQTRLKV